MSTTTTTTTLAAPPSADANTTHPRTRLGRATSVTTDKQPFFLRPALSGKSEADLTKEKNRKERKKKNNKKKKAYCHLDVRVWVTCALCVCDGYVDGQ